MMSVVPTIDGLEGAPRSRRGRGPLAGGGSVGDRRRIFGTARASRGSGSGAGHGERRGEEPGARQGTRKPHLARANPPCPEEPGAERRRRNTHSTMLFIPVKGVPGAPPGAATSE